MRDLLFFLNRFGSKRYKFLLLFLLSSVSILNAQTKVSGVVSDAKGLTLPGVNVTVKGSNDGVSTDFDGKYQIDVPANSTLVFSFIGFTTQEVAVGSKTTINIKLSESSNALDEVVVIGYGTQKKGDVNSSISSVKAKDLQDLKQVNIDQMIQEIGRAHV